MTPAPAPRLVPVRAAPEPKPAPAPRAERTAGGWRVQLGAFRDAGNAQAQWAKVRAHMTGASPSYEKAGAVTRLLAGPFASRDAATRACAAAKGAGSACVVVGR